MNNQHWTQIQRHLRRQRLVTLTSFSLGELVMQCYSHDVVSLQSIIQIIWILAQLFHSPTCNLRVTSRFEFLFTIRASQSSNKNGTDNVVDQWGTQGAIRPYLPIQFEFGYRIWPLEVCGYTLGLGTNRVRFSRVGSATGMGGSGTGIPDFYPCQHQIFVLQCHQYI